MRHYVDVAEKLLKLKPPLLVEAGATEVNNLTMILGNNYFGRTLGQIYNNEIKYRHTLSSLKKQEVDKILLSIFEDFFDAAGEKRPENYRNFPAKEENKT